MDRLSLQELREQLPVTEEVGYFQTGTYGPTLSSALKAVRDAMEYEALHGPARPETRQYIMEKEEAARGHLADLPTSPRRAGHRLQHDQGHAQGAAQLRLG